MNHPINGINNMQELVNYIYLHPKEFKLHGDLGNRYDQSKDIASDMMSNSEEPRWQLTK